MQQLISDTIPTDEQGPNTMLTLIGTLRPNQVPPLFQLISAGEQTGSLKVNSRGNEIRVDFIGGRIVSAASRNSEENNSSMVNSKLGHLLLRQGKINEQQRDQALLRCNENKELRFGDALVEIGILTQDSLQASLREQAKMTLRSLLIFPEGDFDFETCQPEDLSNEGLDLTVEEFLRLARVHDAEWAMIRDLLPSRDMILGYTEGGRNKADAARMNMHQQLILSLVDGRRSIRQICQIATLHDFEVYQFLYMMTKAGIMAPVPDPTSNQDYPHQ